MNKAWLTLTNMLFQAAALFRPNTVLDKLIKLLPDIDPDSTRMVEWIWSVRQKHGLSTVADKHTIIFSPGVTLSNVSAVFKDYFKHTYTSDRYFRGMLESDCGKYIKLYIVMVQSDAGDCSLCCVGDGELVAKIMSEIRSKFRRPESIEIQIVTGFGPQGPEVRNYEMTEADIAEPQEEFYPWLDTTIENLIDDFNTSKSNVLLLIGPPGTGKTSLIRKMLFRMKRENIGLIDDGNVQAHPGISSWVRGFGRGSVLVFEDADKLVEARENGNTQMSMLLNLSDGVVNSDTKIIISTNLPSIARVDDALLRPGRNYAILEFRELTAVEANAARAAVGLEPADFDENGKYKLAEALAHKSVLDIQKRKRRSIGFVNS